MAVLVTERPLDPAEVWRACEGRIPQFAVPRFLRFVDALPKTPSEKVRKAVIREEGITATTHDRSAAAGQGISEREPAVDVDQLPGQVGRRIGQQEVDHGRDLL